MSEYTLVELELNDGDCIKAALKELGYVFEEHKEAQQLVGYGGDRRQQRANIIVRRQHVGNASNDVGFHKKANGDYDMIISEFDRSTKNGSKFMNNLKQIYGKHKFLKQAKRLGFKVKSQKVDEKGRIKIRVVGN